MLGSRHIRTLGVAALCHDLGQYPYSHVLEDSERDAEGRLERSVFDHERLTAKLLSSEDYRVELGLEGVEPLKDVLSSIGTSTEEVLSILTGKLITNHPDYSHKKMTLLRSILNGPLDADKLDYLERDGHHTGVGYGRIDGHRFFQALTVIPEALLPSDTDLQIALTPKGRVPAEQLMIGRLHMFTEVYWHSAVRAHEAVFATAVQRLRSLVEGFDEWFESFILRTGVNDEWYLELLRLLDGSVLKIPDRDDPQILALLDSVERMVKSLDVGGSGRSAYTELMEISNQDRVRYRALQRLRFLDVGGRQPAIDKLANKFAARLSTQLSIPINDLDIVFDIPPQRSPANTAFIVEDDPPKRQSVARLGTLWPMWEQFVADFHERMSVIRVFVPRQLRDAIEEQIQRNDLILYEALGEPIAEVFREHSGDLPLFAHIGVPAGDEGRSRSVAQSKPAEPKQG